MQEQTISPFDDTFGSQGALPLFPDGVFFGKRPSIEVEVMKVRELVKALQRLSDQDATVVIGEGTTPNLWLIVAGIVERRISVCEDNPDSAGPGFDCGIEIV